MIDLDYPALLKLFPEYLDPKRWESASFLIWYLENYYRLDPEEAVDSVCDQRGDKGVDGIFVNDSDQTVTVFQAKINQDKNSTIGDNSLRTFAGALRQFESPASVQILIETAGTAQVAALAKRLDLAKKIGGGYQIHGEFIANVNLDGNGDGYLKSVSGIDFIGKDQLLATYISNARNLPIAAEIALDISGFNITEYTVDAATKAVIAPIKASELVALSGIADQSLFAYNVRGPLGGTPVNKEIAKSVQTPSLHKVFPLFHNGITIISKNLAITAERVTISEYYVVNGCQSLTTLYKNKDKITGDLRILTKIVQMEPSSKLAVMVTEYSNSQNGVKPRDFMSNNRIQIRLQNEVAKYYGGRYAFRIKTGESSGDGDPISNEQAGLWLMAFDLKEPWGTHRKYQVFDEKHADLFGRQETNADRIVLCQTLAEQSEIAANGLANSLFGKYTLTRFMLIYAMREILETDETGKKVISNPMGFVRDPADQARFRSCIKGVLSDVVIDINDEVKEYGDDFDYRDKLRDSDWVKSLVRQLVRDYLKQVARGRIHSFGETWKEVGGKS